MAQPMFGTTGAEKGIRREFVPFGEIPEQSRNPPRLTKRTSPAANGTFDPLQKGFHLEQRGGMDTPEIRSKSVTPLGKFAAILLLFALAVLFLPKEVRGWFVIIILLGAFTVNPGAINEFKGWLGI